MRTLDLMKRVKGPDDIPNEHHFAVIVYGTHRIYVPGDERSRTCPGHGYPAHTDVFDEIEHWVTIERSDLEAFVTEFDAANTGYNKKPYVVLEVARKGNLSRNTKVQF